MLGRPGPQTLPGPCLVRLSTPLAWSPRCNVVFESCCAVVVRPVDSGCGSFHKLALVKLVGLIDCNQIPFEHWRHRTQLATCVVELEPDPAVQ